MLFQNLELRIKVGRSYNGVMFCLLELVQPERCRNAAMGRGGLKNSFLLWSSENSNVQLELVKTMETEKTPLNFFCVVLSLICYSQRDPAKHLIRKSVE